MVCSTVPQFQYHIVDHTMPCLFGNKGRSEFLFPCLVFSGFGHGIHFIVGHRKPFITAYTDDEMGAGIARW